MRGSWRANRNPDEPRPERGRPRCPKWLDDKAKETWAQLVPQLDRMGVLAKIDGNALARYCRLHSRWRAAEDFLQQQGDTYLAKDADGHRREGVPAGADRLPVLSSWPSAGRTSRCPARLLLTTTSL
jgi:P27 family predicted phage terminase small subunit